MEAAGNGSPARGLSRLRGQHLRRRGAGHRIDGRLVKPEGQQHLRAWPWAGSGQWAAMGGLRCSAAWALGPPWRRPLPSAAPGLAAS